MIYDKKLDEAEKLLCENPDSTLIILSEIDINEPRHIERKARYALLFLKAQDKIGIQNYNDSLLQQASIYYNINGTPNEKFMCYYLEGKRCLYNQNKAGTIYYLSKAYSLKEFANSDYTSKLEILFDTLYKNESQDSTILKTQQDYLFQEFIKSQDIITIERKQTSFLIIILVIVVGMGFLCLQETILNKNKKEKQYLDVIDELKTLLNENDTRMSTTIKTMFREQYKILNNIGASLFNKENDVLGHKMLYYEVCDIVDKFKQENILYDIEGKVNIYCNNVMNTIREEFPDFTGEQYKQICLHIAGFSSKLIGAILDISEQNVNVRKYRIKKKITQSYILDKSMILSYLD